MWQSIFGWKAVSAKNTFLAEKSFWPKCHFWKRGHFLLQSHYLPKKSYFWSKKHFGPTSHFGPRRYFWSKWSFTSFKMMHFDEIMTCQKVLKVWSCILKLYYFSILLCYLKPNLSLLPDYICGKHIHVAYLTHQMTSQTYLTNWRGVTNRKKGKKKFQFSQS